MKELSKTRLEVENAKRQIIQQEIAFNIQQTDALTRFVYAKGLSVNELSVSTVTG
jgi:GH24 family phage-related lysozyme (muramidase)